MNNPTGVILRFKSENAVLIGLCLAGLALSGCYRGRPSDKPPVHPVPDMDRQPKYKTQEESQYFEDGAAMRKPVSGTVPQGFLRDDVIYYSGRNASGIPVKHTPVTITLPLLQKGQRRYNIYCAPCHSKLGDGKGILVNRGYIPPPTFHDERIRNMADGHIFDVISNGIRNMPSHRHQITVEDRWAIVSYLRALQRSQNAKIDDIPDKVRETLE